MLRSYPCSEVYLVADPQVVWFKLEGKEQAIKKEDWKTLNYAFKKKTEVFQ